MRLCALVLYVRCPRASRIQNDHTGIKSPGWKLQRLVVTELRDAKSTYYFNCGQWLSIERGDGAIVRELSGTRDPLAKARLASFKVTIQTGVRANSSCDCDVLCILFGSHGDSGERRLVPARRCFMRDGVDEFLIECQYIGELERLRLRHKNNGQHSHWFIENVLVFTIQFYTLIL